MSWCESPTVNFARGRAQLMLLLAACLITACAVSDQAVDPFDGVSTQDRVLLEHMGGFASSPYQRPDHGRG
jgi:hypothetical protein